MFRSAAPTAVIALLAALAGARAAVADVVVIANRARAAVTADISPKVGKPYSIRLASGQVTPLFSDHRLRIGYQTRAGRRSFLLDANSAYYFAESRDGRLAFSKIGFGGDTAQAAGRKLPGGGSSATPAGVIDVRIYVDDEQPQRRDIWERVLRARVRQASAILLRHSGVALRVAGVGRWESDNQTNDFFKALGEFEREVAVQPGELAIGFASQYEVARGRVHLGGTRGPLNSHILLREWSQKVSEQERLELLVHELGHHLGATHSPEPDSVMRPVVGGPQSRAAGYDIRFDPANTLIISMVGEELRRRRIKRFGDLTPATLRRIGQVYDVVAKALPGDKSAKHFAAITSGEAASSSPLNVRKVVQAVTSAASDNRRRPAGARLTGDRLAGYYVRAAAAEAGKLSSEQRRSLLLALGIALDDTSVLRSFPLTRKAVQQVDPPWALDGRLSVLGEPTLRGRPDLVKHFFVSAALVAVAGPEAAHAAGLAKEALDSQGASGFSFADLAADRAGVRFAQRVLAGALPLDVLAKNFRVDLFMPSVDGLPERLPAAAFQEQYGGVSDPRFQEQVEAIDALINRMPAYGGRG